MNDPIAYRYKEDTDTMYFHQTIHQLDKAEFIKEIIREVNGNFDSKDWNFTLKDNVPKGKPVLDSVCEMKLKSDIKTWRGYKWKARLKFLSRQKEYGRNYTETYSPVAV